MIFNFISDIAIQYISYCNIIFDVIFIKFKTLPKISLKVRENNPENNFLDIAWFVTIRYKNNKNIINILPT